jgi:hypothetical protein
MSRNGSTGQTARPPARRHPPEEQFAPTQAPAGWPPAQQHYPEQQQGYGQQQGQGFYFPPAAEGDQGYGYAPQPGGYPPQATPAYTSAYGQPQPLAPAWGQPTDPRGFDLGNYMPAQQGYAPAGPHPHAPLPAPEAHFGPPQHDYGDGEADYDDSMGEEDEEPRHGRRGALIAAALVGAIALGGAMAYTYKAFVGGGGGHAPLIRLTDSGPNKVKPDDPGGREFAHTDKKLLNRLSEADPPASEPDAQDDRAGDDPNAPRKVRVIPIASGSGGPVVTTASVPARPAPVTVNVPGVMLENLGPPQNVGPPPVAPAQMVQQPPPAVVRQAPVRVASAAPPASEMPAAEAPAAHKVTPAKPAVPKVKQAAAAAATSVPAGGSGFVAVLASKKSRMDALKAFADLQQKYPDVLGAKTPDVQEANLGDKGLWYRVVVGPPGSREAASGVCTQLKSAGHSGCWVAAF